MNPEKADGAHAIREQDTQTSANIDKSSRSFESDPSRDPSPISDSNPQKPPNVTRIGRPRKLLSPQQIDDLERLAECGATREEMGAHLGMKSETLARRLNDQPEVFNALARAGARLRTSLRRKQIAVAFNDKSPAQATMLVWLGKSVLGQSDRVTLKIETQSDALTKLKEIWPDIPEDELIRQLTGGGEVIDVEAEDVEATG